MKRVLFCVAAWTMAGWSQQPVIAPGGVVNAASYAGGTGPAGLAGGSIATIFGTGLAASTETAQSLPLPLRLGGTSVSVYGSPRLCSLFPPTRSIFKFRCWA
jgi:hypothetical protein